MKILRRILLGLTLLAAVGAVLRFSEAGQILLMAILTPLLDPLERNWRSSSRYQLRVEEGSGHCRLVEFEEGWDAPNDPVYAPGYFSQEEDANLVVGLADASNLEVILALDLPRHDGRDAETSTRAYRVSLRNGRVRVARPEEVRAARPIILHRLYWRDYFGHRAWPAEGSIPVPGPGGRFTATIQYTQEKLSPGPLRILDRMRGTAEVSLLRAGELRQFAHLAGSHRHVNIRELLAPAAWITDRHFVIWSDLQHRSMILCDADDGSGIPPVFDVVPEEPELLGFENGPLMPTALESPRLMRSLLALVHSPRPSSLSWRVSNAKGSSVLVTGHPWVGPPWDGVTVGWSLFTGRIPDLGDRPLLIDSAVLGAGVPIPWVWRPPPCRYSESREPLPPAPAAQGTAAAFAAAPYLAFGATQTFLVSATAPAEQRLRIVIGPDAPPPNRCQLIVDLRSKRALEAGCGIRLLSVEETQGVWRVKLEATRGDTLKGPLNLYAGGEELAWLAAWPR
jgi:hypothetical protein